MIATGLILAVLAWNLTGILPLIVVSTLLSYLLWPLVNIIEHGVLGFLPFEHRALAVIMTFVVVLALFGFIIVGVAPLLLSQLADLGDNLPRLIEVTEAEMENLLSQPVAINGRPVLINGEPIILMEGIQELTGNEGSFNLGGQDELDVMQMVTTFFGSLGNLTGPAFSVVGGAVDAVFNLTFLVVIMFYMMRDGQYFVDQAVNITPEAYKGDVKRLLYELGKVWNAYLRGQLILSVVIGSVVYAVALLLGLPNAPLLGLISGMLEFIPNLGPFIALIPAALTALVSQSSTIPFLSGPLFAIVVVIIWTNIQQLESLILFPRVMGGSLKLHPLVVIIAVIAGASIAGALGVILAAPFTASARLFGQYLYGKIFDVNPFPNPKPQVQRRATGLIRQYTVVRLKNARSVYRRIRKREVNPSLPNVSNSPE